MRCLPLALTRGPLLTQVMREAQRDPRRRGLCGYCSAPIPIRPERPDEPVRCPCCLRMQTLAVDGETPWRLTPDSAEALRRTKSWVRCY